MTKFCEDRKNYYYNFLNFLKRTEMILRRKKMVTTTGEFPLESAIWT